MWITWHFFEDFWGYSISNDYIVVEAKYESKVASLKTLTLSQKNSSTRKCIYKFTDFSNGSTCGSPVSCWSSFSKVGFHQPVAVETSNCQWHKDFKSKTSESERIKCSEAGSSQPQIVYSKSAVTSIQNLPSNWIVTNERNSMEIRIQ